MERNWEREEYCRNVLAQMNDSLKQGAEEMQKVIETMDRPHVVNPPSVDSLPEIVDPNRAPSGFGGVGGFGGAGFGQAGVVAPMGTVEGGGAVVQGGPDWSPAAPGAPAAPDTPDGRFERPRDVKLDDLDGVGLVERPINQTVTPNGLVGGYTPPSATHASDPRWDPAYRIPQSAIDVGKQLASSAALGAGAGVSARALLSGAATAGTLAGGGAAAAGGAGLKAGAAVKGAGGAMMGAPMAGGAPAGEDKGKGKRRLFSGVFSKHDKQEETGPVWDPAHGPGSEDDGVVFEIDLDEWGL